MSASRNGSGSGIYVFDVLHPVVFPVVARAGQVLVVAPGTPHPMQVVERGTCRVIREGPPNYGALLHLIVDGVIVCRSPRAVQQLAAQA